MSGRVLPFERAALRHVVANSSDVPFVPSANPYDPEQFAEWLAMKLGSRLVAFVCLSHAADHLSTYPEVANVCELGEPFLIVEGQGAWHGPVDDAWLF